jgi:hypothetical protein
MKISDEWNKYETVKMEDGRLVDFPLRIKALASHYTDSDTGLGYIRLDFRNGSTRTFSLNPDTVIHLALEGADRKLRLAMAGASDLEAAVIRVDQRAAALQLKDHVELRNYNF